MTVNDTTREYVQKRLEDIMPIMQKIAMGDFSESIPVPEEEDEFTAHFIALNFMIDDLRDMMEENTKQAAILSDLNKGLEKEVKKRTGELQRRMEDLEMVNKVAIDRELKMIELKKEIADLKKQLKA